MVGVALNQSAMLDKKCPGSSVQSEIQEGLKEYVMGGWVDL